MKIGKWMGTLNFNFRQIVRNLKQIFTYKQFIENGFNFII